MPLNVAVSTLYPDSRGSGPYIHWIQRNDRAITGAIGIEADAFAAAEQLGGVAWRTNAEADPVHGRAIEYFDGAAWVRKGRDEYAADDVRPATLGDYMRRTP